MDPTMMALLQLLMPTATGTLESDRGLGQVSDTMDLSGNPTLLAMLGMLDWNRLATMLNESATASTNEATAARDSLIASVQGDKTAFGTEARSVLKMLADGVAPESIKSTYGTPDARTELEKAGVDPDQIIGFVDRAANEFSSVGGGSSPAMAQQELLDNLGLGWMGLTGLPLDNAGDAPVAPEAQKLLLEADARDRRLAHEVDRAASGNAPVPAGLAESLYRQNQMPDYLLSGLAGPSRSDLSTRLTGPSTSNLFTRPLGPSDRQDMLVEQAPAPPVEDRLQGPSNKALIDYLTKAARREQWVGDLASSADRQRAAMLQHRADNQWAGQVEQQWQQKAQSVPLMLSLLMRGLGG